MDDLHDRVRTALGGHRESSGPGNTTPILGRMSNLVRAAGVGAIVALSACTTSPSQYGNYRVGGESLGSGLAALTGNRFGHPVDQNGSTYRPDSYGQSGYAQGYGQQRPYGYGQGGYGQQGYGYHRGGLDPRDIPYAKQAAGAAEIGIVGERYGWNNPVSGNSGYYSPIEQGELADGRECRRIETVVSIGGMNPAHERALFCRRPDGEGWRRMSQLEVDGAKFASDEPEGPSAPRMG